MTVASSLDALKFAVERVLRAGGSFPIYMPPEGGFRCIPYPEGDSSYDGLRQAAMARLLRVAKPYNVVTPNGQTLAGLTSDLAALPVERRNRPQLRNLEVHWLAMLNAATGSAVSSSWRSSAASITEFARYNAAYGTSLDPATATLEEFRTVAIDVWQRADELFEAWWETQRGLGNVTGDPVVNHYAGNGLLAGDWATHGIPWPSVRMADTLPLDPTSLTYWADNSGSNRAMKRNAAEAANPRTRALIRAQMVQRRWGQQVYCFFPTNGRAVSNSADWQTGISKYVNGVIDGTGAPIPIEAMQYWLSHWASAYLGHSTDARALALSEDGTLASMMPLSVEPIWYPGPACDVASSTYLLKNHWGGLFDDDPAERVRLLFRRAFVQTVANRDSAAFAIPNAIWLWDAPDDFYTNYPTNTIGEGASTSLAVMNARYGWCRMFLGTPMTPSGAPIGSTANNGRAFNQGPASGAPDGTNGGVHCNHFHAWTLAESWLRSGATRWPNVVWWDPADGGTKLPAHPDATPRSLFGPAANGHRLARYLNPHQQISGPDVRRAYLRYAWDNVIRQAEALTTLVYEAVLDA